LKKPTGSVRFRFFKPETGKTEPNRTRIEKNQTKNRAKPEKTEPNRKNQAKPVFALKNRTEPNRNRSVWTGFGSVSVFFFLKNSVWLLFLIKTEPNRTVNTPTFHGDSDMVALFATLLSSHDRIWGFFLCFDFLHYMPRMILSFISFMTSLLIFLFILINSNLVVCSFFYLILFFFIFTISSFSFISYLSKFYLLWIKISILYFFYNNNDKMRSFINNMNLMIILG